MRKQELRQATGARGAGTSAACRDAAARIKGASTSDGPMGAGPHDEGHDGPVGPLHGIQSEATMGPSGSGSMDPGLIVSASGVPLGQDISDTQVDSITDSFFSHNLQQLKQQVIDLDEPGCSLPEAVPEPVETAQGDFDKVRRGHHRGADS